jgi:hypothetical protein
MYSIPGRDADRTPGEGLRLESQMAFTMTNKIEQGCEDQGDDLILYGSPGRVGDRRGATRIQTRASKLNMAGNRTMTPGH